MHAITSHAALPYDALMHEHGLKFRWRFGPDVDPPAEADGSAHSDFDPLIARLMRRRGVADAAAAESFLKPKLTDLHEPALLPGAVAAAERMQQAVADGQPIVIYGDYDVDGITASAILWHTLTLAGANVSCYVPHRLEEGYGLNVEAIEQLGRDRPLIVSVDCGVTAHEPAAAAKAAGVDLIITDHHELPDGPLPPAHTVVHPRLTSEHTGQADTPAYPFGYLCGAGVAFKLAWQFARTSSGSERVPQAFRALLLDLLSLAALGTVADVVPLVDENRVITSHGLGQVKRTRFAGLNALIDASRLRQEKVNAFHVGFVLGPRLNACGRMGHASKALHLLTQASADEAAESAAFLAGENERRRQTQKQIVEEAQQMVIEGGHNRDDRRAIVLGKAGWHAGVLGIVAARMTELFARPVVLLNLDNGEAHGSARSVDGVALHEAIASCAPLLNSHGGHAMAAGVRLDADNVDAFREKLIEHVNGVLAVEDMVSAVDIDADCALSQMNQPMIEQVLRLAPFGRGNAHPLFCARQVQIAAPPQVVGREGMHLRLQLRQGQTYVNGIGFGLGELIGELPAGMQIDLVFEPTIGLFQGQTQCEYHIKDIKPLTTA